MLGQAQPERNGFGLPVLHLQDNPSWQMRVESGMILALNHCPPLGAFFRFTKG